MPRKRKQIPQGRTRALDGGQLVHVCPVCGEEIPDGQREVVMAVAPDGTDSMGVELDDTNYREHWRREH